MVGHGGSSAGSYLADPTSPIPSHCVVTILFKSVPVHQLSWLALYGLSAITFLGPEFYIYNPPTLLTTLRKVPIYWMAIKVTRGTPDQPANSAMAMKPKAVTRVSILCSINNDVQRESGFTLLFPSMNNLSREGNVAFNATPNPFLLNKICLNLWPTFWHYKIMLNATRIMWLKPKVTKGNNVQCNSWNKC